MLMVHGFLGRVVEPWVPPDKRLEIINEARAYLLGYGLIVALSIVTGSWVALWLWCLPVAAGQWFLRPYLLAEHTGCAHGNDMLENTRTTYTNAWVRFFAWNMPYHAKHHAYTGLAFPRIAQAQRAAGPASRTHRAWLSGIREGRRTPHIDSA